jgi:hypothetical protein
MPWRHMWVYMSGRGKASLVLKLGTRSRWVVSFIQCLLYTRGKSSWYQLSRRLAGPLNQSGCFGEKKNILPLQRIKPQFLSFVACSLVTIPTAVPQLQWYVHAYMCVYVHAHVCRASQEVFFISYASSICAPFVVLHTSDNIWVCSKHLALKDVQCML